MKLLLLGGTGEAVALACRLARQRSDIAVTISLAGLTRHANTGPGRVRRGGFGGAEGLADWLVREAIDALIDATHPFAATMARHAARAARDAAVPRLKLARPMWPRQPGDRWLQVDDAAAASAALARLAPASAFLALGRRDLAPFAPLAATMRFLLRTVEPVAGPPPLANARLVLARGPFTLASERALFAAHGIEALVTRAAGGAAGAAKIAVARERELPVIVLARPPLPPGPVVTDIEGAVAWLARRWPDAGG